MDEQLANQTIDGRSDAVAVRRANVEDAGQIVRMPTPEREARLRSARSPPGTSTKRSTPT